MSARERVMLGAWRGRRSTGSRSPDGRSLRSPFGRGPIAARVLSNVIDGAVFVGGRLPASISHGLARVGGFIEWAARPAMRRRLGVNLAHAASAPIDSRIVRSLVRQEMANEARRSADLLWAIARPADLLATLRVDGLDHVNAAVARGRGVLLAGIHVGGWEVAAAAPAALIPVPTTVIVADNWLAWAMHNARANAGLRILYRDQAALGATHLLRRGEAVLVLGDDAFGSAPRRHHVAFCDSAAWLPAGVVALSRITDAPIVPFEVLPEGPRRWHVQLGPLIEPPLRKAANEGERETLQLLADHWTAILRQYPQHWAARFSIGWDERT